jgi:type VI secretion system protein ImpH
MCGTSFFDCAGAFRLRLGPMGADQFARFIPGSPTARRLAHWIRAYLGDELYWDAEIILRREDVSLTRLGRADSGIGSRLGWTSWILSKPSPEDRSDLLLRSAF